MNMYRTNNNWFVCYNVTEKDKNKYKLYVYCYSPYTKETKVYKVKANNMNKVMQILTGIVCDIEFDFSEYKKYLCETKQGKVPVLEGQMVLDDFVEEV